MGSNCLRDKIIKNTPSRKSAVRGVHSDFLDDSGRLTSHDHPPRDVLLHEAESPDHTPSSDANTGHDDGVVADPDIVFDGDRASRDRVALLEKLGRVGTGIAVDHDSDRERHAVADLDPGASAVDHAARVDIDIVSDEETVLGRSEEDGSTPDLDVVPELRKVGMHVLRQIDIRTRDITSALHVSPQCA